MADAGDQQSEYTLTAQVGAGFTLAIANFMVVLDLAIANVSIPQISGNVGASLEQGYWVITSYAIAEAICVLLCAWLSRRIGTVRLFMVGMAGFGMFSLLCGLSFTLEMLVIARIGQGIFGAFLMPVSQILLLRVFPPRLRNLSIALWGMTLLLGPALGPLLGGWLTDNWGWHWIFLINIPPAILCLLAGRALLSRVETEREYVRLDFVGFVLIVIWVGCLQVALDIGRQRDWYNDTFILTLLLISISTFLIFLIWELTENDPIVDFRIFRHRGFSASLCVLSIGFGAHLAGFVIVPQWQQTWLGYTASIAGYTTSITAFAGILTASKASKWMSKFDPRVMISGGLVWMAATSYVRTSWTSEVDFWTLVLPQFFQGLGMTFFLLPCTNLTLASVRPNETATAASMQSFVRTIVTAFATSISLTYWNDNLIVGRSEIVSVLPSGSTTNLLPAMNLTRDEALLALSRMVDLQASTIATIDVFSMTTAIFLIGAALIWLVPNAVASLHKQV